MNDVASIALTCLGPLPILYLFFRRFRDRLRPVQNLAIAFIIYFLSFATGWLTVISLSFQPEFGNVAIGLIAGIIAPLIYCSLYTLFSPPGTPPDSPAYALPAASGPSTRASDVSRTPWNPVVIAAVIQAVGTIIVALIALWK
jgi:hypothetical protein